MRRFVFGAAALVALASSPAAAERPWRHGGYTGDRRCAALLHWASLEPSGTAAEKGALRGAMLVVCRPAGAAPPKASPPPARFIQVRWSVRRDAGGGAGGHVRIKVGKNRTAAAGATAAWTEAGLR